MDPKTATKIFGQSHILLVCRSDLVYVDNKLRVEKDGSGKVSVYLRVPARNFVVPRATQKIVGGRIVPEKGDARKSAPKKSAAKKSESPLCTLA